MGKRYALVGCFLALLGLALSAAAQPTVNVGSIPIGSELPLHAAIRQGFFDEEGINLKVQVVAGGAAAIPALVLPPLILDDSFRQSHEDPNSQSMGQYVPVDPAGCLKKT